MKANDWNNDNQCHAPAHGVNVWVAYESIYTDKFPGVFVRVGFFDSDYRKWRFEGGAAVSQHAAHVVGWLPIEKPTYEVEE